MVKKYKYFITIIIIFSIATIGGVFLLSVINSDDEGKNISTEQTKTDAIISKTVKLENHPKLETLEFKREYLGIKNDQGIGFYLFVDKKELKPDGRVPSIFFEEGASYGYTPENPNFVIFEYDKNGNFIGYFGISGTTSVGDYENPQPKELEQKSLSLSTRVILKDNAVYWKIVHLETGKEVWSFNMQLLLIADALNYVPEELYINPQSKENSLEKLNALSEAYLSRDEAKIKTSLEEFKIAIQAELNDNPIDPGILQREIENVQKLAIRFLNL